MARDVKFRILIFENPDPPALPSENISGVTFVMHLMREIDTVRYPESLHHSYYRIMKRSYHCM